MAPASDAARVNGTSSTNGVGNAAPADDDLEAERLRLESELAATRTRIAVAKERLASRQAAVEAAMRRELAAAREAIGAMEREHQDALAALRRPGAVAGGEG